jgi:hypothetical protein
VPATPEEQEQHERDRVSDVRQRLDVARAANRITQGWQHRGIVLPEYPALTHALDGVSGWCLLTGGTGVGKTTLTLAASLSVAMRARLPATHQEMPALADECSAALQPPHAEQADVVYLSTEMTWAEQYHAMVCMLAGVWWREYTTKRGDLAPSVQAALNAAERILEQLMVQGRLHLLSTTDVQWAWQDGWQHALRGVQDAVQRCTAERRTLLVVDTLATLPVQPAVHELRGLDSFERDELVVDGCTQLRHWLERTHSAMLTVTEEAKHLTGSADMHSARGSAAYTYRASQRLALVSARAEKVGTRSMGVRCFDTQPDCSEADIHILKARQGGHGGAVVPLLHAYTSSRLHQLDEMQWGERAKQQRELSYWTASQLDAARRSADAKQRRKDEQKADA